MYYYLAPYIGAGTRQDPFRPVGADQSGWAAIDLRPDTREGFALIRVPDKVRGLTLLGEHHAEPLTRRSRSHLHEKLRTEPGVGIGETLARALLRPPVRAWKRLQVDHLGRYEVWLGGVLLWRSAPMVAVADNFNRTNETPLAAPWTELAGSVGDFNLSSNVVVHSAGGDCFYYYSGAAAGANQYSQAQQVTAFSDDDWGPACRILASSGFNAYFYHGWVSGGIAKYVTDGYTSISASPDSPVNGDTMRIEASGSTLRAKLNGVEQAGSPQTDTSLAGAGNGVGIFMFAADGSVDNWEGGELGGPILLPSRKSAQVHKTRRM